MTQSSSTTSPSPASGSVRPPPPPPRLPWHRSFGARLTFTVCGLVLCASAVLVWLAHRRANTVAETLARSLFKEVSDHAVTRTRAFVDRAIPIVRAVQQLSLDGLAINDSDRLARQLLAIFNANEDLSWISFGDEAGTFTGVYRTSEGVVRVNQSRIDGGRTSLREHDVTPDGTWRLARRDDDSGYDPRTRPFYVRAKEANDIVWMPPYVFYDQGVLGVSCAGPVHDREGKLQGVVSVDFDLNALSDFVGGLTFSPNSTVAIFGSDGQPIAYPGARARLVRGQRDRPTTAASAADQLEDPLIQTMRRELGPNLATFPSGTLSRVFEHDGDVYLASASVFRPSEDLAWIVAVAAPKRDFLSGVWRGQRVALAAAAIAVLLAVLAAVALARRVSGPVTSLIGFMRRVGAGDLDTEVSFSGNAEFADMARALNHMIAELRDRLRLRHSLSVAMQVQQRLLPQQPPRVRNLDVAGHSTYCDETGGDYYDFLLVDQARPDLVLVALGDVMGHGVAAALVMAGVRAVLRDRATVNASGALADLMARLNRFISDDHGGERFMTMHLSLVDAATGTFRWVSAGHDPAFIYDPDRDHFDEMDLADLPLGVLADGAFEEHRYGPLRPGQVIVIGTDGIWETADDRGEMFGKDRLRAAIRTAAAGSAAEMVREIRARLADFRGNSEIIDDVTFVVLKFTPLLHPLIASRDNSSSSVDAWNDEQVARPTCHSL